MFGLKETDVTVLLCPLKETSKVGSFYSVCFLVSDLILNKI